MKISDLEAELSQQKIIYKQLKKQKRQDHSVNEKKN